MNESNINRIAAHIQAGQEFMQLYVVNERRIYAFIFAMVHDWSATEDILQESAQVMWSKFDEFQIGTDFAAWALSIARYQVMNYRKKQKSTKVLFDSELIEQLAQKAQNYAKTEHDRRHEALKGCLKKLTRRDRRLIEARYEFGTTAESIADRFGWHIKSVYRSLKRIRFQLFLCIRRTLTLEEQR